MPKPLPMPDAGVHTCTHCGETLAVDWQQGDVVRDSTGAIVPTNMFLIATCWGEDCPVHGATSTFHKHAHLNPVGYLRAANTSETEDAS
jgi:hypothetical protein